MSQTASSTSAEWLQWREGKSRTPLQLIFSSSLAMAIISMARLRLSVVLFAGLKSPTRLIVRQPKVKGRSFQFDLNKQSLHDARSERTYSRTLVGVWKICQVRWLGCRAISGRL